MKRIALSLLLLFAISLPFQWWLLDNKVLCGINTLIFLYAILRYKGWLK